MKALAIVRVNLLRLLRDRVGLFFVFVFPVVLILMIGATFGGGFTPRLGVFQDDAGAGALLHELRDEGIELVRYDDLAALEAAVERGAVDGGVVVPPTYSEALERGRARIRYVGQADDVAGALRRAVDAAAAREAAIVAAARLVARQGESFEAGLETARRVRLAAPLVTVMVERPPGAAERSATGRFDLGAATQLVLFTFVNSLAGSAALVQTRTLGLSRRMLATPTRPAQILAGEAAGRFGVAMVQGVFIIIAAAVLFGVGWGDPAAAAALMIAFALVSTGAAMLAGAFLSNEQQVGALTPFGLALAALGGCMVPLEVFSPTMQTIARVTPHAWAVDGFTELIRGGAGTADILPQLGALMAFAAVLLGAAVMRLRRAVVG